MRADDPRTVLRCDDMRRYRASDALMRFRWRDRGDEEFSRGADQQRQAERVELAEMRQHGKALLVGLAEADAGIEHDVFMGDAGAHGDIERAGEISGDVLHDVD